MWWKRYKWYVLTPVILAALLAGAFFLGGPKQPAEKKAEPAVPTAPAVTEAPEEAEAPAETTPELEEGACLLSVSCAVLLDDADRAELAPPDGWILPPTAVAVEQGESVFDLLQRVCRAEGVHMEFSHTPLYDAAYIEGIGNLYEFDCGSLSGWLYRVNGEFPHYSSSRRQVQPGDVIEWVYTCDLGADVGGSDAAQAQRE